MADYGARYADRKISEVNRSLKSTYRTAQKELKRKLAEFERRFEAKNEAQKKLVESGKISKDDYKDWLTGQVFIRSQWEAKIRQVSQVMVDCNRQSMRLINEKKLDVFAENYNYNAYKAEQAILNPFQGVNGMGISFDLYNSQSVARLILDDPQILPEWKIDEKKDYEWNYQKVNNIVKQGIIQGEGIPEITKRLCEDLSTMNENRMKLFARTAMTGAQNAGRQKQMEDAADMGIEVHKQWLATHDNRTRDSHRHLDGEEVPYNEDFSNGVEYPGDPDGDPAEVYNCRCTMVTIYPKYEDRSKPDWRETEVIDGQSYAEWKLGKRRSMMREPYYPYTDDIIREEKKIVSKDKEVAVCIDRKTGRTLFEQTSNLVEKVYFKDWQLVQMKDQTVIHNHPDGGTLSYQDIMVAMTNSIKEVRSCCGNEYRSLERLYEEGKLLPKKYYQFAHDYRIAQIRYQSDSLDGIYAKTKDLEKCRKLYDNYSREWLKKNAGNYGWRYTEGWIEK